MTERPCQGSYETSGLCEDTRSALELLRRTSGEAAIAWAARIHPPTYSLTVDHGADSGVANFQ